MKAVRSHTCVTVVTPVHAGGIAVSNGGTSKLLPMDGEPDGVFVRCGFGDPVALVRRNLNPVARFQVDWLFSLIEFESGGPFDEKNPFDGFLIIPEFRRRLMPARNNTFDVEVAFSRRENFCEFFPGMFGDGFEKIGWFHRAESSLPVLSCSGKDQSIKRICLKPRCVGSVRASNPISVG